MQIHPEYQQVLKTYLKGFGTEIVEIDAPEGITDVNQLEKAIDDKTVAVLIQIQTSSDVSKTWKPSQILLTSTMRFFIACVNPFRWAS